MNEVFAEEFYVEPGNFVTAGEASAKIKNVLKMIGISASLIRRLSIATYEAEMNMVIHSKGGKIRLEILADMICMRFQDTGPGIDNIDEAMKEGFSTAPSSARTLGFGAGMGLPNIKKNSDTFDITSSKEGTSLALGFNIDKG